MSTQPRYPLGPLAALLGLSGHKLCEQLGISGSTAKDYRTRGVTERVADRLACRAGVHPYTVWPEMADHAIAELQRTCAAEDCGRTFLVDLTTRGGHNRRWCSNVCRSREAMRRWRSTPDGRAANRRYARLRREGAA